MSDDDVVERPAPLCGMCEAKPATVMDTWPSPVCAACDKTLIADGCDPAFLGLGPRP